MEERVSQPLVALLCVISRASSNIQLQSTEVVVCGLASWTRCANVLHLLPERSPGPWRIRRAGRRVPEEFQQLHARHPPQGVLHRSGVARFQGSQQLMVEAHLNEQLRPSTVLPSIEQGIAQCHLTACQAGQLTPGIS